MINHRLGVYILTTIACISMVYISKFKKIDELQLISDNDAQSLNSNVTPEEINFPEINLETSPYK